MPEPEIRAEGLKPENKATISRIKEIQEILSMIYQSGRFILSNLYDITNLVGLKLQGGKVLSSKDYDVTTSSKIRFLTKETSKKLDEYLLKINNQIQSEIKETISYIKEQSKVLAPEIFIQMLHLVLREVSEKTEINPEWAELKKVLCDIINSEDPDEPSHFYKEPESVLSKLQNSNDLKVDNLKDLIRATLIMNEPFATLKDLSNVVNTIIENYQKICGNSGYLLDIKVKPKKPSAENSFYNFVKGRLGENCYLGNGYNDVTIRFVFISEGKNGKKYHRVFEIQTNTQDNIKAKHEETTNYDSRKEDCNKINRILENYTKTTSKEEIKVLEPEQVNWIMKGCMDNGIINTNGEIVKEVEFKNIIIDCLENLGYDFRVAGNKDNAFFNEVYNLFLDYKDKFIESCKLFERTQRVIASEADVLAFTKLCEEENNNTQTINLKKISNPKNNPRNLKRNTDDYLKKLYRKFIKNKIKDKLEDKTTVNQV
jgi:hypothetical protein